MPLAGGETTVRPDLKGARVHVTGGAGFLGTALVKAVLEAGGTVSALLRDPVAPRWKALLDSLPDHSSLQEMVADVRDQAAVRRWLQGAEVVVHLAARAVAAAGADRPRSYYEVNFDGTLNLLEAGRLAGLRRFVHLSTAHVYGPPQYLPIDEQHPLLGTHPYAASKLAAEAAVRSYGSTFGLHTTTLRPSNIYGPGQTEQAVIPTIIKGAIAGQVTLRSLSPVRDFVFVDDVVDAILRTITSEPPPQSVLNLSSGEGVSVEDLAKAVLRVFRDDLNDSRDVPLRAETKDAPGRDEIRCSNSRAFRVLGWRPSTTLDEGLRRTVVKTVEGRF